MEKNKEQKRTIQQNKALHKYFELIANDLNDAGYDMKKTLKKSVEIPWSKESVKDFLWRPIMGIQLRKKSTKEMTTKDIDKVYDTLNRLLSEKFGISEPFPSIEEL